MVGVLDLPIAREGSGTSWLPDDTPMYAIHTPVRSWNLMLHGDIFLQYIDEGSDRGDEQFGSINWLMGMARRSLAGGQFWMRAMLSAEPWTVGECGYPDLLATGERCHGRALHDRQHPHDLFMELAAGYNRAISDKVAFELYGGPSAEPALGPTAFPHRLSAFPEPLAPITHHWLDATHISFGVITAGVFTRRWKVEGSIFNGREPDEDRADIDLASLNSYSLRLALAPGPHWSLQVSAGQLNDAEFAHETGGGRVDVTRYTASAIYHHSFERAFLATTLAYGLNNIEGTGTNAILAEGSLNLADKHLVAGRFEWVQKTGEELALNRAALENEKFGVAKAELAYTYQFPAVWGWKPGIGAGAQLSFIPEDLEPVYQSRPAAGFVVFGSLRPRRMRMSMDTMPPVRTRDHHH